MTNKMQIFGLFIWTQSVLHVSDDVFAHHQKHLIVFTASDIVHLRCCRPAATLVDYIRSCKYSQVLLMMGENIARNMLDLIGYK